MAKVENLFQKYQQINNPAYQRTIFYLLDARMASGLENREPGSESLNRSTNRSWLDAAHNYRELASQNPQTALDLGLALCRLPRDNPNQEKVYRWMRTDGPILLAHPQVFPKFNQFLDTNPQAPELLKLLDQFISHPLSRLNRRQTFNDPDCFLAIAAVLLATKLDSSHPLHQQAVKKLSLHSTARIIGYYASESDTSWLADEFQPLLPKP